MPASNRKLTGVIKGRTIGGTGNADGVLTVTFSDGSKMTVKTAPTGSNSASTGGTVQKVRQSVEPPVLYLDMENGSTFEVPLAEATSSVFLRDKDGRMEYAD
jgi:hypothetical protein